MSQPTQVASQFLSAYYRALDTNPASVGTFYQDVSTLSFQGESITGKDAIASKLAGLGVPPNSPRRITATDAQESCVGNGAIVVFVTGEWAGQQYQEAFHLVPTSSGGFYVHNCIFRLASGGGNTFNVPAEAQELTKSFISHYYSQYDGSLETRRSLHALYTSNSNLSMEGQLFRGQEAIMGKLLESPLVQHDQNMLCDTHCVNNIEIVIFFLSGQMSIDGANPMKFAQFFQIQKQGASYIIGNQIFRLNYG